MALLWSQFQGLQLEREACLASNYALAKENLALRPRLEMGRAALAIKYQELREVAESCADKLQRLGEGKLREPPGVGGSWQSGWLALGSVGAEGWELGRPIPGSCLKGTLGKWSWGSEQLVSRAGLERPEGVPWAVGKKGA